VRLLITSVEVWNCFASGKRAAMPGSRPFRKVVGNLNPRTYARVEIGYDGSKGDNEEVKGFSRVSPVLWVVRRV
jgi:hypothetical protein